MTNYAGFITIPTLADNAGTAVSPIGELSKYSQTFSTDIKTYMSTNDAEFIVNIFTSPENHVNLNITQLNVMSDVFDWVIGQAETGIASNSIPAYLNNLANYAGYLPGTFSIGPIISLNGGNYPSSVRYESGDTSWTLWLSDSHFRVEYPEYSVRVVLPMDNIDALHLDYPTIDQELSKATPKFFIDKLRDVGHFAPPTIYKALTFKWYLKTDPSVSTDITFMVAIHGQAGDNVDVIREAVADAILELSSYDRLGWATVLPEIFSPNEMMLIPLWDAVQENYEPLQDSIYFSALSPKKVTDAALAFVPDWSTEHIEKNTIIIPTVWRGIVLAAVNHEPIQGEESHTFADLYPDYILAPSTSTDFHRMDVNTREIVNAIMTTLTVAEDYNDFTVLDVDVSQTVRSGKEFLTFQYNEYLYHVLTKRSFDALTMEVLP